MPSPEEYTQYARNAGFALVADVGDRFLDQAVNSIDVTRLDNALAQFVPSSLDHSTGAFAALSTNLGRQLMSLNLDHDPDFYNHYAVTDADRDRADNHFFRGGFGNLEFSWHISPAIAVTVIEALEKQRYISGQQRERLTLCDWAEMMRSEWFSDVMHDLALTSNGVYRGHGEIMADFNRTMFVRQLQSEGICVGVDELFTLAIRHNEETGLQHITAGVSEELRRQLRQRMRESGRIGCPVARRAGAVSLELALGSNPHFDHLLESGRLTITGINKTKGLARFRQLQTPIDVALQAFCIMLERYDTAFGTPTLSWRRRRFRHRHLPKSNIFTDD